ncbi:hypothetical protein AFCA_002521 [Aspergillus flavus]|nr:hypothetical protein AFCA_002521 [Aspergillus flavus]
MKGFVLSTLATLAGATVLIGTQNASVVTASLTAAATTVSPKPTTLFPAETVQLTNEVLAAVSSNVRNANISDVFHFADPYTDSTLSKKNPRSCKVMPGDVSWPKNLLWNTLDTLLGKRLIKTVPLAAYCYPEWPEYDADKCANITSQWAVSNLHMYDPVSIMLPRYEGRTCMAPGYNYTKTCGGHSPLSSMYGMAADQVLAMEVILANGRFITASSTENSDIFWMLRGGGGSTIGVVTSLIVKALPRLPTTTVTFNFTINDAPNVDAFWKGIEAYFVNFEDFINAGTYGYYYVGASATEIGTDDAGSTDYYFRMHSVVAPNMTIAETKALLAPWYNVLDSLNITYTPWYNHADNFHDSWASGAYMSEADLIEPNLQEAFYGANYPALYALKQKYDPTSLFFALTAVGAEDGEVRTTDPLPYSWNNNGRLCPVSS